MMTEKATTMVMASLAADSLALGVHWNYDPKAIAGKHGRVADFLAPEGTYHKNRKRGEFTHYGDQTVVLLESLADDGGFDLDEFALRWRVRMRDYDGYLDKATKRTMENFSEGMGPGSSGSDSDDFSAASRIAPLVFRYRDNLTGLLDAARAQTIMTHNSTATLEAADFFARLAFDVLQGQSPVAAMKQLAADEYPGTPVEGWVSKGLAAADRDTVKALGDFGRACPTPQAFPGVVQTIARYENDLEEALIQTVMAGGDSSARGMMVGLVLGAHLGPDQLPGRWVEGLAARQNIMDLLGKIESQR